jgi:hypothetical protein
MYSGTLHVFVVCIEYLAIPAMRYVYAFIGFHRSSRT